MSNLYSLSTWLHCNYKFLFVVLSLSLFGFHCASAQTKDQKNLEQIRKQALNGDKKGYEGYEKAIESANEEKDQDLKETIIKDLSTIPTEESREILKKEATSGSEETRQVATEGLYDQREFIKTPETATTDTVEVIKSNAKTYNEITSREIEILAEIQTPDAVDVLISQLHKSEQKDSDIIQKLSEILATKQGEWESATYDTSITAESKTNIQTVIEKIKQAFVDYSKSEASDSLKEAVLLELYNALVPDSRKVFTALYNGDEYDENGKLILLKLLGYRRHPDNDVIISGLREQYIKAKDDKELERILKRISMLSQREARTLKSEMEVKKATEKKRDELLRIAKNGHIFLIKSIFKKYNITESLAIKIQNSTEQLALDNSTPMNAQSLMLFSGVRQLYPDKNYFELKKTAQKALQLPNLFTVLLNIIDHDYTEYDMKIYAIQTLWKVNDIEAAKIYKAYSGEKIYLNAMFTSR